mgnify:CR=1 FL=1
MSVTVSTSLAPLQVLGQVRAFFALPLEAKESLRVNRWNRGYMPSGTEVREQKKKQQE